MPYAIIISSRAKKQIDKLPATLKEKIANLMEELAIDPFLGKPLQARLKGLYSYRIGNYRIIYDLIKKQLIIQIVKVMHRKDVYR